MAKYSLNPLNLDMVLQSSKEYKNIKNFSFQFSLLVTYM